jgi:hypothetical protein
MGNLKNICATKLFFQTLKCKSGAIKVTMNWIIKSTVGFKVYIIEIFGRNLSQFWQMRWR